MRTTVPRKGRMWLITSRPPCLNDQWMQSVNLEVWQWNRYMCRAHHMWAFSNDSSFQKCDLLWRTHLYYKRYLCARKLGKVFRNNIYRHYKSYIYQILHILFCCTLKTLLMVPQSISVPFNGYTKIWKILGYFQEGRHPSLESIW